ncbi:hypothetical protein NUW58_g3637 [Xylaria curta]|uniref:Uncharacterized protein n=1 Tax=Xylaria curta TaxID=42375 RepID=A0ACC1PBR0_9PEZI|nr:hypothetical protein NUW58_g3637 [Xylaria curta]
MSYKSSIWQAMRYLPVTLVSATYGTDGQLRQNIISGPELAPLSLPEEGLYICEFSSRNRGLQIASARDQRKCYLTQVCRCTEQQQCMHGHATTPTANLMAEQQSTRHASRGSGKDRMLAWLNLYQAVDKIRSLRICFLTQPRTLSWNNVFENLAFRFDSDLEEHYTSSHSYKYPAPIPQYTDNGAKECPWGFISFVRDAWRAFLGCEDYDVNPVAMCSEREDECCAKGTGKFTEDGELDDISDWDDADTPIHGHAQGYAAVSQPDNCKRGRPEDEFDLIDDLIEEEFPRLKKTLQNAQHKSRAVPNMDNEEKTDTAIGGTGTENCTNHMSVASIVHKSPPAPVIIPPKNMLIGRGLSGCFLDTQQGPNSFDERRRMFRSPRSAAALRMTSTC